MTGELEKLILRGEAEYKQFTFAYCDFNVISVPEDVTCVVLGFDLIPSRMVIYSGGDPVQTVQRVELSNRKKYFHQFFKMKSSNDDFISVSGMYGVFQDDFGVMVTVPKNVNENYQSLIDTLDSAINPGAEKVLNLSTNPINTTPQFSLKGTRSSGAGTTNIPSNNNRPGESYSSSFTGGFVNNEISQYNWISEADQHYYNDDTNYTAVSPTDLIKGWYITLKTVFINKQLASKIL